MITVFTPTYNRAEYLPRLYQSLLSQTCFDFEWIIVDDESKDDTKLFVEDFIKSNTLFNIKYYLQSHGGKHRAINKGVKYAEGDMFFIVDSDDYIVPDAIDRIKKWSEEILMDDKFAGVSGMKILPGGKPTSGEISGKEDEYIDALNYERRKFHLQGDQAEVYKTKVLKKFPFPEYESEYFITEAVVWDKIAENGLKIRWYKIPIYICEYLPGGLTKTDNKLRMVNNFQGFCDRVILVMRHYGWSTKMNLFMYFNWAAHKKGISFYKRYRVIQIDRRKFYTYYLFCLPPYASVFLIKKFVRRIIRG